MGNSKHYEKYIYCLEGDWDSNLKGKSSILPALELLELNCNIKTIYKTCSTKEELINRFNQLLNAPSRYEKYQIIYLCFHGFEGGISIGGKNTITLKELAELYKNKLKNKIIHFGSCSTLDVHKDEINDFIKQTKALCISGYQKDIDFISSTVFDVLYFELSQNNKSIKTIEKNMFDNYKELCEKLEFKMFYEKSSVSKMEVTKSNHKQAYEKWTTEDDLLLLQLYYKKKSIAELSEMFERNKGAIESRLKKLLI